MMHVNFSSWRIRLSITFLSVSALWMLMRLINGLQFPLMGDETEKIIASQLITKGERLYSDIFAHHGPLNYIISHAVTALFPSGEIVYYRTLQIIISLIFFSLLFKGTIFRATFEKCLFLGLSLFLYGVYFTKTQGHLLLYHSMAGFLVFSIIVLLVLPAAYGRPLKKLSVFLTGFFAVLLLFTAYSYVLALFFVLSSSIFFSFNLKYSRAEFFRLCMDFSIGCLVATLFVAIWLLSYSDIRGYLVFHFYFNQAVYSEFINFSLLEAWQKFSFSALKNPFIAWSSMVVLVAPLFVLIINARSRTIKFTDYVGAVLFFLALVYLDPRHEPELFKSAALQITCLVLAAYMMTALISALFLFSSKYGNLAFASTLMLCVLTIVLLRLWPGNLDGLSWAYLESKKQNAREAHLQHADMKSWLDKRYDVRTKMVSVPWNIRLYQYLDREPAINTFYFLPWQAAYQLNPIMSFDSDYCVELRAAQPEIVLMPDNASVWGYALDDYAPCVRDQINQFYQKTPFAGLYVLRTDEK